eukprot:553626_1
MVMPYGDQQPHFVYVFRKKLTPQQMKALVNDLRQSQELGGRGDDAFVYVEKKEKTKKKRQYSAFGYHLFSLLVHSDSTYGSQWYKFDGENVMEVDVQAATVKQFGGDSRQ